MIQTMLKISDVTVGLCAAIIRPTKLIMVFMVNCSLFFKRWWPTEEKHIHFCNLVSSGSLFTRFNVGGGNN